MKMLEVPEYALFEIHEFGERRLGLDEKPLLGNLFYLPYNGMISSIFQCN